MAQQNVAQFWRDLRQEIQKGKEAALEEGAKVLYKATLDTLQAGSPGKGRRYKRGRRRFHTASRAGDAPARDTGRLIRAVAMQVNRDDTNPTAAVGVRATAPYAKYLDPVKGQPEPGIGRRPFLSKAFDDNRAEIRRVIAAEMDRHLRRVGRR